MAGIRTTASVTVRDRNWVQIQTAVKQLDGAAVKVGIRARDAGKMNDGVAVVDYAIWNEYGTSDGHVPKRPFMRHTADTSKDALKAVTAKWADMLVTGRLSVDQVLSSLGEYYKLRIQSTIRNSKAWAVPNKRETIRRKGSTTPLVDKGVLLNTIDWERER